METTPMTPIDADAASAMWRDYAVANPGVAQLFDIYEAEQFGDSAEMADELLALILDGRKRATSSHAAEYRNDGDQFPAIGSHWISCDGSGIPRAIRRIVELRVAPFAAVDAQFAYDEGEDDRTLESWRHEHWRFFSRVCAARRATFSEDDELILERFAVVWPPEVADAVPLQP
ncbi:ASCH domain-containing protein [Microbacterium sp. MPKO10]|uniref:ASCH domain-containing protein n=1 Tax=Microbacterium sp. MPKO10 TaxID=2989818 RepID=UPI0022362C06|nr:ASCH domain-containing protein [Microbacterium sp. MPKO10]MCW4457880.1 ASCH domain-containing protein [Microbacterium sp. MPKO10]